MATSQWIPPLPPGYEARWDPNQKAYFFINHADKTTSWQDPRWPAKPPQAQQGHHAAQGYQSHHTAAAHSLNTGYSATGHGHGQNVPMTTMYKQFGGTTTRAGLSSDEDWEDDWESDTDLNLPFKDTTGDQKKVDIAKLHQLKQLFPSAPESSIKHALLNNNNVMGMATVQLQAAGYKKEEPTSHPPPRVVDMLERLKAMYPTANADLVRDILAQANHDEKAARAQLEAIGYRAQYTPTHKSSRETTPKRTVSPVRETSPKHVSPTKPSLTEAQKARLLSSLKSEYKDTEESVITMALQVCDYDETRVKNLLERMTQETETPRPSSSRTDASSSRRRSPSPTPIVSSTSLEPVAIDIDISSIDRTKKPGTSSGSSRTTPDRKKAPSKSSRSPTPKSAGRQTPSKTSRTPTPKSSTTRQQQQRAKKVTELSEDVLSSTMDVLNHLTNNVSCCPKPDDQSEQEEDLLATQNEADSSHRRQEAVVSRQPVATSSYVSPYRTTPKGPDPSLRAGPNPDLLIKEYALAKGPNPDLRKGPDHSLAMGPQGAVGPDRSLCCGPMKHLLHGVNSENRLVTAV